MAVALSVLTALVLTACADTHSSPDVVRADRADGGSRTTDTMEAPADPAEPVDSGICGVLTQAEVEAALGRTVGPGVEDSFDGEVARCTWTVTTPPPNPELSDNLKVEVLVLPLLDIERAEIDGLAADPNNIVVDGLGDLAVIENIVVASPMYVVLGDEYLEVDVSNFRTPADFTAERLVEILIELATLVVPRI